MARYQNYLCTISERPATEGVQQRCLDNMLLSGITSGTGQGVDGVLWEVCNCDRLRRFGPCHAANTELQYSLQTYLPGLFQWARYSAICQNNAATRALLVCWAACVHAGTAVESGVRVRRGGPNLPGNPGRGISRLEAEATLCYHCKTRFCLCWVIGYLPAVCLL